MKNVKHSQRLINLQGAELALQYKYQKQPRFVYGYNLDHIHRIEIKKDFVRLHLLDDVCDHIDKEKEPLGYNEFKIYLQSQVVQDDINKAFESMKATLDQIESHS